MVLKWAHDNYTHAGIGKIFQMLRQNVYFPRIVTEIEEYMSYCPGCDRSKPLRYELYGSLKSIMSEPIPLSILYMDLLSAFL
jgi:hypothetical protein